MGHEYMRFYYEDAVLLDGGSEEVWLATPYDQDDLLDIHFDQVGDTLRLTHAAYAPMLLSRTSTTSFTLTEIPFERGPFLLRNDLLDPFNPSTVTMQSSVIAKNAVGTLTCSRPYFVAGHVGALMKIWHPLPSDASQNAAASKASLKNTGTKTSYSIRGKGTMQFQTTGTWKGSVTVYRSYDEGITWDEFRPAFESLSQGGANHTLTWEENDPNTQYRMMSVIASQSGDSGFGATLKRYDTLHGGICRITAVNSTTEAAIIIVSALASTDATRKWAEGAWSTLRGFPASLTFFGGRAIYAGSISQQDPMAGLDYPQLRNMPG